MVEAKELKKTQARFLQEQAPRVTNDGLQITASQIQRLEKKRNIARDQYDQLKIFQLTNHGNANDDPQRRKREEQQLKELRTQIKQYDGQILEIRLALKDSV